MFTLCGDPPYRLTARESGGPRSQARGMGHGALGGAAPNLTPSVDAIAMDGKTLHGSKKQGAPGAHRLSATAHRVGLTLTQQAVDDTTHAIPVALALLRPLVLEGRIGTRDAWLTQRQIAQQSVAARGDDVRHDALQAWGCATQRFGNVYGQ